MGSQTYQQQHSNEADKKREADKSEFEWRWQNYLRSVTMPTTAREIYTTRPRQLIWFR